MRMASLKLLPSPFDSSGIFAHPVRFLTGRKIIHQTIFCAHSFQLACGTRVRLEFYDDGTLCNNDREVLQRNFPDSQIPTISQIEEKLDRYLPRNRFPLLRSMRDQIFMVRKLLDVHIGHTTPSLYLDSDMLFFRRPDHLLEWIQHPEGELFMHQGGDSLVSPRTELSARTGCNLAPSLNAGLLAIDDGKLDWDFLEAMAGQFTPAERAHIWAEQTLFAFHLGRRPAQPLPREDYVLCHDGSDLKRPFPVLRHYVHKAKYGYVAYEWRRWLAASALKTP